MAEENRIRPCNEMIERVQDEPQKRERRSGDRRYEKVEGNIHFARGGVSCVLNTGRTSFLVTIGLGG